MTSYSSTDTQVKIMAVNSENNFYTSYHPYKVEKKSSDNDTQTNYPVNVKSDIPAINQWSNPNDVAPKPMVNGGLYGGPQSDNIGVPKPVVPTTTYFMQELLGKTDIPPPPGAKEQYPHYVRPGNNYIAMPNVSWYNPKNKGPYRIKVINDPN